MHDHWIDGSISNLLVFLVWTETEVVLPIPFSLQWGFGYLVCALWTSVKRSGIKLLVLGPVLSPPRFCWSKIRKEPIRFFQLMFVLFTSLKGRNGNASMPKYGREQSKTCGLSFLGIHPPNKQTQAVSKVDVRILKAMFHAHERFLLLQITLFQTLRATKTFFHNIAPKFTSQDDVSLKGKIKNQG